MSIEFPPQDVAAGGGATTDVTIENDGTYLILKKGALKLLKTRISDGTLFVSGGVWTDENL